jgi:hypothetical protein
MFSFWGNESLFRVAIVSFVRALVFFDGIKDGPGPDLDPINKS